MNDFWRRLVELERRQLLTARGQEESINQAKGLSNQVQGLSNAANANLGWVNIPSTTVWADSISVKIDSLTIGGTAYTGPPIYPMSYQYTQSQLQALFDWTTVSKTSSGTKSVSTGSGTAAVTFAIYQIYIQIGSATLFVDVELWAYDTTTGSRIISLLKKWLYTTGSQIETGPFTNPSEFLGLTYPRVDSTGVYSTTTSGQYNTFGASPTVGITDIQMRIAW
jgi:hypothetical protein